MHGVEYAYGAHENPTTGIFEGEPRQCPGFAFRKSILIGRTDLGPRQVRELMESLAETYTGSSYNLISKNCNHFCDEVCLRLTSSSIPRWVNRLARLGFPLLYLSKPLSNSSIPISSSMSISDLRSSPRFSLQLRAAGGDQHGSRSPERIGEHGEQRRREAQAEEQLKQVHPFYCSSSSSYSYSHSFFYNYYYDDDF